MGDVWGNCVAWDAYGCRAVKAVGLRQFVSDGPMFELDAGARLGRHYMVHALWERAQLGAGNADSSELGGKGHGETDFLGVGLRLSTDPDRIGFLVDLAIGVRRLRAIWPDGTELQLSDAPLESRLGVGAEFRLTRAFSVSPLLTLGLGSFGTAEWIHPDRSREDAVPEDSDRLTHGWITIQMGGHFDVFAAK